jgi:hypothetical protein
MQIAPSQQIGGCFGDGKQTLRLAIDSMPKEDRDGLTAFARSHFITLLDP